MVKVVSWRGRQAGRLRGTLAVNVQLDGDGLEHHPQPVSTVVVRTREEVAPGRAVLLVLKLNGHVLLLGAPLVHLGDLADVPAVVALAEPACQLLADLQVVRQPRRALVRH